MSLIGYAKLIVLLCLSSLCSLCLCGESSAALDGEAKQPYQLTVVLHFAEHRLLTNVFRDRVERELRDGLQAALGELAEVKVVREHPQLKDVLDKGLLRSLDAWKDRSAVKTHFVLIDFSGVDYEIQARQYDGMTGLTTPVVRHEKTQDREFVARTASLMVERDFGIIATFPTWPKDKKMPQKVQLELKGGGLDAPLAHWVKKGDVFAVVQMPTGNGAGRVIPYALVQIETPPREGGRDALCTGNLFWRYDLSSGAGVAGYRCVKLGAVNGPLNVRLVQSKPGGGVGVLPSPLPTLWIRRLGFSGEDDTRLEVKSDGRAPGTYDTSKLGEKGRFDRVAFVSVRHGGDSRAKVPLAVLDDQPVVVPVTLLDKDNDTTLADSAKRYWMKDVFDSYLVQSNTFTELQAPAAKNGARSTLIEKAREGVKRSDEELERLKAEREELYGGGKVLTAVDRRDLAQADSRLKAIGDGAKQLKDYIKRQEEIDKEEHDPKRQRWLEQIERGKLLEKDGELGKAITIYETILHEEGFKDANLEAHLKQLREIWKPKSESHRAARDYIYNTWPTLDTAALKTQIKDAQEALEACRIAGDTIAPQKLYKGIQIHAARLLKEAEALQDKVGEDDVKQLKDIKEIGANLVRLEAEIKAYLDKAGK